MKVVGNLETIKSWVDMAKKAFLVICVPTPKWGRLSTSEWGLFIYVVGRSRLHLFMKKKNSYINGDEIIKIFNSNFSMNFKKGKNEGKKLFLKKWYM